MRTINFLYEDTESGENFIVEVEDTMDAPEVADDIAAEYFENPIRLQRVSDYYAETCGLDTY